MDISLIVDTVNVATTQGLGFAKFLLRRHCVASYNNNHLSISAVIFAVDAIAPPTVRSNYSRTARRTLLRKKRRTRRKSSSGGDSKDGEDKGFFGDGGDGGDGPFGGGGGRGWNFDGFGGHNWDGSSSDPAFNFVYEVIYWIVLSNCVHFAFKKIVRIVGNEIGDAEREKVPMRLTSVC